MDRASCEALIRRRREMCASTGCILTNKELCAIGYAFPAPTGIVDYNLRRAGSGTPSATIVASAGPFQAHGLSIDGSLPIISTELQLPMGASYQISTQTQ